MSVIAALVLATAFPILAPEKTPVVRAPIGPTSGGVYPAIATDGMNFLVVSGPYAMLVDRDGNPLLPRSVVIPSSTAIPAIASNGSTYLAAPGGGKAVLLDRFGALVKTIDLGPIAGSDTGADVAWDGTRYIVVQQTEPQVGHPSNFIRYSATFISDSGEVLGTDPDAGGNRIAARDGVFVMFGNVADVIAGDDGFLVVWQATDPGRIMGRHLDRTGAFDSEEFVIANGTSQGGEVRGAWTGRDYAVLLCRPGSPNLVHVTRTGAAGAPVKIGEFDAYGADVAWNGNSALVTWTNLVFDAGVFPSGQSTRAGRLENDLVVTNKVVHRQYDQQMTPQLVTTGAGLLALWSEFGEYDNVRRNAVAGSFVTVSGSGARIPLPTNGNIVAVAGGPSSALVVQFDGKLRPTIVTPGGAVLVPVVLATEINGSVAATRTGREYVVTWAQPLLFAGWSIYALRIAENGTVLDPEPRHIVDTFQTGALAIASNGRSALIVDYDRINGPLRASFVNESVKRIHQIAGPGDLYSDIRVTTDGTDFLVTWFNNGSGKIRGLRIGANGEVIGGVRDYAQGPLQRLFTFWTGENYLLVWTSLSNLWAIRVSPDGNPIDAAPNFMGTLDSPALSIAQLGPSQLAMISIEGRPLVDPHLIVSYALTPRKRSAVHR